MSSNRGNDRAGEFIPDFIPNYSVLCIKRVLELRDLGGVIRRFPLMETVTAAMANGMT